MSTKPILVARTRFPGDAFARAEELFDVRINGGPAARRLPARRACRRRRHLELRRARSTTSCSTPCRRCVPSGTRASASTPSTATRWIAAASRSASRAVRTPTPSPTTRSALLLAVRHNVVAGDRFIREGQWGRRGTEEPEGRDITGTTARHRRPRQHRPRRRPPGRGVRHARRGLEPHAAAREPASSTWRSTTCSRSPTTSASTARWLPRRAGLIGARELAPAPADRDPDQHRPRARSSTPKR